MAPDTTVVAPEATESTETINGEQLQVIMDTAVEVYTSYVRLPSWPKRRMATDAQYSLMIESFVEADASHRAKFWECVAVLEAAGQECPGVSIHRVVEGFRQRDWNGTALADLLTGNPDKAIKAWAAS